MGVNVSLMPLVDTLARVRVATMGRDVIKSITATTDHVSTEEDALTHKQVNNMLGF